MTMKNRAGTFINQPGGFKAFIPKALPPEPPLRKTDQLDVLLSAADRAIGRLDAATELLPNPELFVRMFMRQEAVYSSQIEGTQASLSDLLEFETETLKRKSYDAQETANYITAMKYGLERLETFPISLRLIREIHEKLMFEVRGNERQPGEFRTSQNWVGPPGSTISNALYIPPPPNDVSKHLGNLELFIREDIAIPPLIKCGLVHAQFETIHPFLDGNGRIGRLLITFILCWQDIIKRPLLYLSHYFRQHQNEYYDKLQAIREKGDWEGWIFFFLQGVKEVALEATEAAKSIQALRDEHRRILSKEAPQRGIVLLDYLYENPIILINQAARVINQSHPSASSLVKTFVRLGLLEEITGSRKYKLFAYQPYLEIFGGRIPKIRI